MSDFRAYSKEALKNISIINNFTYTQEVLIDLKFKGVGTKFLALKDFHEIIITLRI